LAADVPVGVFLSSGLDSSLVLDSAIRSGARPTAFTIGFPEQRDYDEAAAAARFARDLGVEHVVGTLSLGFADTVNDVCSAFDAPFADASAIATLQLARLARSRVTVALSGTGGDDLFAGYYRHRAHLLQPWLDRVPPAVARIGTKLAAGYGADSRSPLGTARNYLARLAATHRTEPLAQYLALMTSTSSEVAWSLTHAAPWTTRGALSEGGAARGGSVLRQIQAIELQTYVPGDLLTKEDRATMAVGLEARVPLLSNLMIEVAERAEDRQKLRLGGGKLMLREVGRRRLPAYLTSGRKRGFAVPLRDLFAGRWRAETIEWLGGASSSLVECDRAAQLVALNGLRPTDIWALTVLTGWEVSLRAARLESQRLRLS
jgi:asparagine synthase (glutamine-hydrolysing)